MNSTAIVYCEGEFGKIDGKVTNGLARHSAKYTILGIVDSTKAGLDSGHFLDGINNGIPVYKSIDEAIQILNVIPDYFIYGIAAITPYLIEEDRQIIMEAMKYGMNIVNGLPEFFTEDDQFVQKALEYHVEINDIRKSPQRKLLHNFTGRIHDVKAPIISVMGTDCAVGKRTTSVELTKALREIGINAIFIATGQTGLLQGAAYGVAVDVLSSGFASGEVENAILKANEIENPDIFIVEGQGALSHPAYTSSHAIARGAVPDAIILQHPPKRINHCDYQEIPMPTLISEIELIEMFTKSKVIAITINHEDMTATDLNKTIKSYEKEFNVPTTDVLKFGCKKLIDVLFSTFPELSKEKVIIADTAN